MQCQARVSAPCVCNEFTAGRLRCTCMSMYTLGLYDLPQVEREIRCILYDFVHAIVDPKPPYPPTYHDHWLVLWRGCRFT